MTPATVREAVRKALTGAVDPMLDDAKADAIASAVLAAADAGETEGPWRWRKARYGDGIWIVYKNGSKIYEFFSEPEARAVCNALNRVHGRTA